MRISLRALPLLILTWLLAAVPATAQVIAPPLEQTAIELGYTYKWFDRALDKGPQESIQWEAASLYARLGAFKWLTLYAEGGLWAVDHGDPLTSSYNRWVVGGGASACVYHHQRWALDAHLNYNEIYDHDEMPTRTNLRTYGWVACVMARGTFAVAGQRADIYAGPAYVDDVAESYPFSSDDPVRNEPATHWGANAGLYMVAFSYVSGFVDVLYVDEAQFRLGLSLRSRGNTP